MSVEDTRMLLSRDPILWRRWAAWEADDEETAHRHDHPTLARRARTSLDGQRLAPDRTRPRCARCCVVHGEGDFVTVLGLRRPGKAWTVAKTWCLGCAHDRIQTSADGDAAIVEGRVGLLAAKQSHEQVLVTESVADVRPRRE